MTDVLDVEAPAGLDAEAWFRDFEQALTQGDIDAAADMFCEVSYWRDLVAFTWNITTVEGRDGVRDLLANTLANTRPYNFQLSEPATTADGVTDAWFTFETAVGRGSGLARLKEEGAWTFLTALDELKGYEESKGSERPHGVEHGAERNRLS